MYICIRNDLTYNCNTNLLVKKKIICHFNPFHFNKKKYKNVTIKLIGWLSKQNSIQ